MALKFSNPTTSGGGGSGTVTEVSSANTDIAVSSGTTTPILTLNSATTATASKIVKRDTNGKIAGDVLGNAATVTTNANLTGDITSVGNATAIAAGVIVNADINNSAAIDATKIADGSVTSTEFQYINSLTSNAQTQINTKIAGSSNTGTPIGAVTPTAAGQIYADQANGVTYISTGTTNTSWQVQTQYYGMSEQALINGNFDRWERSTSVTNPTSGSFVADRWKVAVGTGTMPANIVHSRQTLTSGDIQNAYYFYRISPDGAGTTPQYYRLIQLIENGTRYLCGLGKKVTISFWARSSIAGKKLGMFPSQQYGSGGSPSSPETIIGNNMTLTSAWTKYTYTFTTNTLVGKTFGTDNADFLSFNFVFVWDASVQANVGASTVETFVGSGNIDISQVKVSSGDADMPYQPKSPVIETSESLRYLVAYTDANTSFPIGNGFALSTTAARIQVELPQAMRIAPSLTTTATDWQLSDGVTATDLTAISIVSGQSSNKTVTLLCTVASGLTQFRPYQLISDGSASRLMLFDAEI